MKFKKIYIEITNICNLDCSFCIKNNRLKEFMSLDTYKKILLKIKNHTDYVYLHLMGEPLMNSDINEIINMTKESGVNVNLTTNGYLLNKIENNQNIRQINISLHSYDEKYNISLDNYMTNIFKTINSLNNTIINYRLWVNSSKYEEIINILEKKYNKKIIINDNGNFTLDNNIFLSVKNEFKWPKTSPSASLKSKEGSCRALIDHIGILVNQDVVACCLDSNGDLKLGNLKENSLEDIISSEKFITMKNNFLNNIKTENLCINCDFRE